jgi:hypothetical protein
MTDPIPTTKHCRSCDRDLPVDFFDPGQASCQLCVRFIAAKIPPMKHCSGCGRDLSIMEFASKYRYQVWPVQSRCRACVNHIAATKRLDRPVPAR